MGSAATATQDDRSKFLEIWSQAQHQNVESLTLTSRQMKETRQWPAAAGMGSAVDFGNYVNTSIVFLFFTMVKFCVCEITCSFQSCEIRSIRVLLLNV